MLFSTDLFAPKIEPVKSVDKTVAQAGEVLTYQVAVRNTGLDPATNVVFRDAIPASTDYVPNSLSIVAGANQGPRPTRRTATQAEFVSGGVVFRLGELAVNGSATVQFKVRVHSLGLPLNLRILNSGTVGFKSKTLDEPGTEETNEVSTRVILPDLEVTEEAHGRLRGWRVGDLRDCRPQCGRGTDPAVRRSSPTRCRQRSRSTERRAATAGAVTPSTDGFRCERSDPLAAGASFPTIRARVQISEDAAGSRLVNVATVTTPGDPNDAQRHRHRRGRRPAPRPRDREGRADARGVPGGGGPVPDHGASIAGRCARRT